MKQKNDYRPMDLTRLLQAYVWAHLLKPFHPAPTIGLPKQIGEFYFVEPFRKKGIKKTFQLGIYRNKSGQKALCKAWVGSIKDYHYYSFKNEIRLYRIINQVSKRVRKQLPKSLKNVYVPQLLATYEYKTQLIALFEYMEGVVADKTGCNTKLHSYFLVSDYLKFLGTHLTAHERSLISQRTGLHYILLYPLLLTKAIITQPRSAFLVIRGIPIVVQALPDLLRSRYDSLVHRDLHFMNIMVAKQRTILIDLQFCVITHPLHELITTLRYRWKEDAFYLLLLQEIRKRYADVPNFQRLFRALTVYSITHGLIDHRFSRQTITNWLDLLKYCISADQNKVQKIIQKQSVKSDKALKSLFSVV